MIQIDSQERPRITITGDTSPEYVGALKNKRPHWRSLREKLILSSPPEDVFTSHNHQLLIEVEKKSREYYQRKLAAHGVEGDPIADTQVVYVNEFPSLLTKAIGSDQANAAYLGEVDVVAVKVPSNTPHGIYSAAMAVQHELGHAAGTSEIRFSIGKKSVKQIGRSGFSRIVQNSKKGSAIEEGLVTLDEMDFYQEYLSHAVPRSFTPDQVTELDGTYDLVKNFFDVSRDDMNVFTSVTNHFGLDSLEIGLKSIRAYSFVKHLARFFYPSTKEIDRLVGPRYLGRFVLDTARFTYSNAVLDVMKETLSPQLTKFVMDLPAWPDGENGLNMDAAAGIIQHLRTDE